MAGLPYYYALSLRNIGVHSVSVKPMEEEMGGYPDGVTLDRKLPSDKTLTNAKQNRLIRILKRSGFLFSNINNFKLIHYYSGTILPEYIDLKLFQLLGKPMIISWAGGDARITKIARGNNPYFYRPANDPRDKETEKRLAHISKYVHFVATDPEMAEYSVPFFEKVFNLKQPVNLNECICRYPLVNQSIPLIYHIPTHSGVKGTNYIVSAIDRLRSEGLSFEFKLLEAKFSQKEMRVKLSEPDIYVDELLCGSYGVTAIEAMGSGKPTITYIREDLVDKFPKELPLVNANPDTIYQRLRELIKDAELRQEIGRRSREYVEKYHSLEAVGPELLKIYREIGMKD
jgi:glycosyltransferase involved in cell wall biosynthesis